MKHRGPDDAGEWWSDDGCVGFGHRRLAIIDLSASGHQPMQDVTGDLTIVFNGEIYNFRDLKGELSGKGHPFRSQSDTEVILAAYREWGTECVTRLNGMFAFAIYDKRSRELFLARDRAGEKPLFYTDSFGVVRFASELKGLMKDSSLRRAIDHEALDCYLSMGFVPGGRCILKDVKKLPPAHALVYELDRGRSHVWRYWDLPAYEDPLASGGPGDTELLEELESLLEDAVRRQLVADVPVGILLSGGVDSSLVTAMAARAVPKVKTFTVSFPGYSRYDEAPHARLIARAFDTEHLELRADRTTVDLLPVLARQYDEPIVDSSMIPTYLVTRLIREHCTVALGGDGGDELFDGYEHYSRLARMRATMGKLPRAMRAPLATAAGLLLPVGFMGRNWLQSIGGDLECGVPQIACYFDRMVRRRLFAESGSWRCVAEGIWEDSIPAGRDLLDRAARNDFQHYMAEDILVKVDRASMLNSLEVRAPLLDYRITEFAFAKVPSSLKATAVERKVLLKRLAARVLPAEFDLKRKQGFSIPLASWLRSEPWRGYFEEVLLDSGSTLFDRKKLRLLLAGHAKGRSNSERLFALVVFELWRREYGV